MPNALSLFLRNHSVSVHALPGFIKKRRRIYCSTNPHNTPLHLQGANGWNNFPYAFEGVSFCSRMVCGGGMRKRRQNLPKRKLTALGKCRLKATVRLSANDVLFVRSLFCNCALVAAQFFGVNTGLYSFILLSD